MGLSNEERITGMTWTVHRLVKLCREVEPVYPKEDWAHLKTLGDNLWHALLGGGSNGTFWILGGALDGPVKGPTSPWGVLIEHQCETARPDTDWERADTFDPFEGFLDHEGLVGHVEGGHSKRALLKIYLNAEALIYSLRRYDDDFLKQYPELNKACSDLLGACFSLMQSDQDFGKAYVGNRLLKWAWGGYDDSLGKVLNEMHFYHDVSRFMVDCTLTEVLAWDKWRLTHKDCPQNRLVLALRMAGRRFHYEHQMKELVKKTRGMGIKESVIVRECAKCQAAHADEEGKGRQEYKESLDYDVNTVIHGYDWRRAFGLEED